MRVDDLLQPGKRFGALAEIINRGVGGIARIAMFLTPFAALGVMLAKGQACIFQFQVQAGCIWYFRPVNEGGKQAFDMRFSWFFLNQPAPC